MFSKLELFKWVEKMLRDKGEVKPDSVTFAVDDSQMPAFVTAAFTGSDGQAKFRKVTKEELEEYAEKLKAAESVVAPVTL